MAKLTLKVMSVVQFDNELLLQIIEIAMGIRLSFQPLYGQNRHSWQGKEYPQSQIGVKNSSAGVCETDILNNPL